MTTHTPAGRVRLALANLCLRAGVAEDDGSPVAGHAVAGVLKLTGCFDAPAFGDEYHLPDACPVAVWIRLETGLAVYVSAGSPPLSKKHDPGRAILVTGRAVSDRGESGGIVASTEVESVELPAPVAAAVRLVDAGHGAHAKKGAA